MRETQSPHQPLKLLQNHHLLEEINSAKINHNSKSKTTSEHQSYFGKQINPSTWKIST